MRGQRGASHWDKPFLRRNESMGLQVEASPPRGLVTVGPEARDAAPSAGRSGQVISPAPARRSAGGTRDPSRCLRPRSIPSERCAARSPTGFLETRFYLTPAGRAETMLGNIRFTPGDRRPRNPTQTPQRLRLLGPGAKACWAVGGSLEVASLMAKTAGSADREEPSVRFPPHPFSS